MLPGQEYYNPTRKKHLSVIREILDLLLKRNMTVMQATDILSIAKDEVERYAELSRFRFPDEPDAS
ncbi:MAG: hypothetical protein JW902_15970 [Syntrophaceae bacterium]|nr:hypothetical protein [Syntrophaceae bacterium]